MTTIVSGGSSSYSIATPASPTQVESTAAAELQHYIKAISGATLPIVAETAAPANALMVGATAFAATNGVAPSGTESWAVKVVGSRIVFAGSDDRGVLYSVLHFLEDELGVHWWNPWEEDVPSSSSIAVSNSLDISGSPSFGYRDIYDGCYDQGAGFAGTQPYSLYYVRNRLNGHFSFAPGSYGGTIGYGFPYHAHTFSRYFPPEQYFDAHPEYYSLIGGARTRSAQLCLSNADVISLMKSKVRTSIAESYDYADSQGQVRPRIFSLTPNDWQGFCQDPTCAALQHTYGQSGYLLWFVNQIAADIATDHPEVVIDTFAYWYYVDPPVGIVPASNVQIRYANSDVDVLHKLSNANNAGVRSKLEAWHAIAPQITFWEYGVNYWRNPPLAAPTHEGSDFPYLHSVGVDGGFLEMEGTSTTDLWDMRMWVMAKYLEDSTRDLTTTMQTFTAAYYGAAGPHIDSYISATAALIDSTSQSITFGMYPDALTFYTLAYVNTATATFDAAASAVAGDATLLRRVNLARTSLDRLILNKWSDLVGQSQSSGVAMAFDRKTSATRYFAAITAEKARRSLATGPTQPYNDQLVDTEIRSLLVPTALSTVPYRAVSDAQPERFRLWTANGGVSLADDPNSILGRAAHVSLAGIDTTANRNLNKPPVSIGLYNPVDGARLLRQLSVSDITPGQYRLYPAGTTRLKNTDYIYLLGSWWVQLDVGTLIAGKPDQPYDVYVSMKFQGPSFGGSSGTADEVWIDRVFLVAKGPVPSALSAVPQGSMTDYSAEAMRLYTAAGGVTLAEDPGSTALRSAQVVLSGFATEADRDYHLVTTSLPLLIGLYNPTDGARVISSTGPSGLVLDQYALYSATNIAIKANDYLYLFRSWYIQCDLFAAVSSDPAQRYDVHVSMKFQGPAYGGAITTPDAVLVDRIIVVRR